MSLIVDQPQVVTEVWEFRRGISLGPAIGKEGYTLATLPSPALKDGRIIWVSDAGNGDGALYVARAGSWKEIQFV